MPPASRPSKQDPFNKPFPCVIELENAVIGALLLESTAFSRIENILTNSDMFSQLDNRTLFKTIQTMYHANESIDMLTVKQKLSSLGKINEAGGDLCIFHKMRNIISSAHIEYHSCIIQQKWMQRQVMLQSLQTYTNASDDTFDIADVMDCLSTSIYNIQSNAFSNQSPPLSDVISATVKTINSNMIRGDKLLGISTGFTSLNEITLGFQKSDFVVIAARPAMGKTAFLGTISKHISVDQQTGCAVFSLEMSAEQLMMRYFSLASGVNFQNIRSGNLSPEELRDFDRSVQTMINSKLIIDDTPALSIEEFRSKLKHMVRTRDVQIAFIDYLQLMTAKSHQFGTRQEEVSFISKALKAVAKELNIPIIALSQLNRDTENKAAEGVRPKLSNLRESGAIEQDADIVCFIHRPEYYGVKSETINNKSVDWTGKAEIIIAKHRNGSTGNITLRFNSQVVQFADDTESRPF